MEFGARVCHGKVIVNDNGADEKITIKAGKNVKLKINDVPSEIKILFKPTQMELPDEDSEEQIDYKNLFRISNVYAGDKIAEIIPEIPGRNGIDVFGNEHKREYLRSFPINSAL